MADLADSKKGRGVLDADSDALNRFFQFLLILGYFSQNENHRHFGQFIIARWAIGAQIFSIGLTFKDESHDYFPNFRISKILHFLGLKSEFYHSGYDQFCVFLYEK